ncbi:MAG TPA: 2-vinyl bacteriochlorophyllide hydratase, partial [Acetobacteraceae bacterium]
MFTSGVLAKLTAPIDSCPWGTVAGRHARHAPARRPLYTQEERRRRDASPWTLVQGVLAPLQFAVFLVSLGLVLNFLATGDGYAVATASVVVKTVVLYVIMVTGSIWEKVVFGRWLFAPAFFWEDVFSILVLALHTGYLATIALEWGSPRAQLFLALAAYAA